MNLAAVASPIKQPAKKASLGRGGPKSAVAAPKQKTRGAAKVRTGMKCRPAGLDSQGLRVDGTVKEVAMPVPKQPLSDQL